VARAKRIETGEVSEAEALRLAQQGDPAAFERIYELHKRRVYSLCLRMVGNTAEAEDLTQEAFLQLFRKIATFRGESAFSTWLYRLVANVVLMHLRKKRLNAVSLDETESNLEDPAPKREFGADDLRLTATTERLRLERAIRRLPPGYRAVFILHDIEGYEHAEVAQILDCTSGNCKSQLHKARLRLRQWVNARPQTQPPARSARAARAKVFGDLEPVML